RRIYQLSFNKPVYAGMGTTIVVLYILDDLALIANVGDSRCYLIRQHTITQLTTDHSWINEQLQKGLISVEEVRQHRWRNIITRALGSKRQVEIDLNRHPIKPGDYFLLCTDGLTSLVEDEEIQKIITQEKSDIEIACEKLVALAKKRGGPDNITVVIVHFLPE
ncbi:MAG: protein phosphatase 2C domain-containing protein, partial [Candidatus Sumerlaeia bacterium]|nr:protein phosphatase 2C domain-containing protein [Candidatus Sumerlaeia bacterium]